MPWYDKKRGFGLGPCLVFAVEKNRFSKDFVKGLIDTITWFYDDINPEVALRRRTGGVKNIGNMDEFYIRDSEKFIETRDYDDLFEYYFRVVTDRYGFDWFFDDSIYIKMMGDIKHMPSTRIKKINRFLSEYRRVLDYAKPLYSWGGDFYYLVEFNGKDARKYFFPVTFYGKEMVEVIGRDCLLSAPVWKAEEIGGGVLLQVAENPFLKVKANALKKVEEHLNLKENYGKFGKSRPV